MTRKFLIAAAGVLALAACSDGGDSAAAEDADTIQMAEAEIVGEAPDNTDDSAAGPPDAPAPADDPEELLTGGAQAIADSETAGGDGSPLVLATLEAGDADELQGELACSFTPDGAPGPIMVGRANVGDAERAQAAVSNGGVAEMLVSTSEGGFDAMVDGTKFGGRGLTVTVTPTSGDLADHEGTVVEATLLAQRGDGAERSWDGIWSCGP